MQQVVQAASQAMGPPLFGDVHSSDMKGRGGVVVIKRQFGVGWPKCAGRGGDERELMGTVLTCLLKFEQPVFGNHLKQASRPTGSGDAAVPDAALWRFAHGGMMHLM